MTPPRPFSLLAYGFRPFFLVTGLYAVAIVLGWMGFLFGGWPLPLGWSPFQWHSHEMLYGLIPAAIAGFLLTAVTNWTGAPPLNGWRLLALVLLWLAGRGLMWLASWVPAWLVALVDLAFLAVVACYLAGILLRYSNRRNLILVAVLTLLFIGNLLMHLGFMTGNTGLLKQGEQLGFNLIVLLMAVIGGRIIPAFSANWLRLQGSNPDRVVRSPWTDRLALTSLALLIPLDLFQAPEVITGGVALVAGILNGVRLWQWSGWRTWKEPLLWILHLGYAWIVLGLLLRAGVIFSGTLSSSVWQHALGAGAMGILLLGVMTRVVMGHTGRPLKLVTFGSWIYLAIIAASVLRVLASAHLIDYRWGLLLSAVFWVLAFSVFVLLYGPLLIRPRADGRPG